MRRISFRTAGESHGRALTAILEGIPAGLSVSTERDVDPELRRRQGGHGRGRRMQIESDRAELLSGVRPWVTNEYEHNGLRADGYRVLDRLITLARE